MRLWPSCREVLEKVEFSSSCVSLELGKGVFSPMLYFSFMVLYGEFHSRLQIPSMC